jgi:hypothetical protein
MAKPRRFLSIRDKKDGSPRLSTSSEPGQRVRSVDAFLSLLQNDGSKQGTKGEQAQASESQVPETRELEISPQMIEDTAGRLEELGLGPSRASQEIIRNALKSTFAAGDVEKAAIYAEMICTASEGQLIPYNPNVKMVGAINSKNVTCWLDSLLFAMFASLDAFECMLKADLVVEKADSPKEPKRKLAVILTLWVNMLR